MSKIHQLSFMYLIVSAMALTACNEEAQTPPQPANIEQATHDIDHSARAAAVVAGEARTDEDRADDPMRKPIEVLAFIAIEPGMTVLEMEAGQGYYSELFSPLIGPEGELVMQNPLSFDNFLGDSMTNRLANGRLANARHSRTNFDELDAADGAVDIVTWILGPHELYYTPSGGDSLGDVEKTYAEIFRVVKPGGTFVVLDHVAATGSPSTTGGTIHRIDPEIVKGLVAGAGFVLSGESDVLHNPEDDYEMSVFDPAVRRKTDRFLLKYKKPE